MRPANPVLFASPLLAALSAILLLATSADAFDQRELQLFDLVEEVNGNFYELLGTNRQATSQEIRRAFRKISLQFHPDRLGKHDEATVDYFRKLNAINEVLKDETLRLRYDEILDHGLPDWRTPMYYYRKWRKMSLLEVMIVFSVAFTVGHYLVLWGVYFERKLVFDDLFRKKSRKKQKQLEEELQQEPLAGPTWRDLLPFAIVRGCSAIWQFSREYLAYRREVQLDLKRAAEEEAEAAAEEAHRREQRKKLKQERREQQLAQVQQQLLGKQNVGASASSTAGLKLPAAINGESASTTSAEPLNDGPWSEAEQQLLVRAVARFPGGTPNRWEKIAALLNRAVPDVTARARDTEQQIRRQAAASLDAAFEINTDGAAVCGDSEDSDSGNEDSDEDNGVRSSRKRRNRRQKQKGADERRTTGVASSDSADVQEADDDAVSESKKQRNRPWSQAEQSQLESALRQFPKGARDRWDQVAAAVGSRSPEECAQRCKAINERLRLKKE